MRQSAAAREWTVPVIPSVGPSRPPLSGLMHARRYHMSTPAHAHPVQSRAQIRHNELSIMPLDSNSRSILGWCVVAVVLLATWLHGNGKGLDQGRSGCERKLASVHETLDCSVCHQDAASRDAAMRGEDVAPRAPRSVAVAPGS